MYASSLDDSIFDRGRSVLTFNLLGDITTSIGSIMQASLRTCLYLSGKSSLILFSSRIRLLFAERVTLNILYFL